jgi:hypothetical protein
MCNHIASATLCCTKRGTMSAPHTVPGATDSGTHLAPEAPEMPAPQVRETTAHSIPRGHLMVLCGDRAAQPVLNTGTLHR